MNNYIVWVNIKNICSVRRQFFSLIQQYTPTSKTGCTVHSLSLGMVWLCRCATFAWFLSINLCIKVTKCSFFMESVLRLVFTLLARWRARGRWFGNPIIWGWKDRACQFLPWPILNFPSINRGNVLSHVYQHHALVYWISACMHINDSQTQLADTMHPEHWCH